MTLRSASTIVAAFIAALATTGCTYALMAPTPPDPRFDRQRLVKLTHGMPQDAVRTLLGQPDGAGAATLPSIWTYEHVGQQRACKVLLFGLTVGDDSTVRHTLVLHFGTSGLESAALTERTSERTLRTNLLGAR